MITCSIPGCDKPVQARGWCPMHYQRWRAHGDPLVSLAPVKPMCSAERCDRPNHAQGLCQGHYRRQSRGASTAAPLITYNDPEKQSWIDAVIAETTDTDSCRDWPWGTSNGYGTLGRNTRVPALVLERTVGPRPSGLVVLHSCDRRVCCAPWHLSWGTYGQNLLEAYERDRR